GRPRETQDAIGGRAVGVAEAVGIADGEVELSHPAVAQGTNVVGEFERAVLAATLVAGDPGIAKFRPEPLDVSKFEQLDREEATRTLLVVRDESFERAILELPDGEDSQSHARPASFFFD